MIATNHQLVRRLKVEKTPGAETARVRESPPVKSLSFASSNLAPWVVSFMNAPRAPRRRATIVGNASVSLQHDQIRRHDHGVVRREAPGQSL